MEIVDTASAGRLVTRILENKNFKNIKPHPRNCGRHLLLSCIDPSGDSCIFYVLFKNAMFHSFSKQFNVGEGFGDSINLEFFKCIERSRFLREILFVYKDGSVYSVSPSEWKSYVEKHGTIRMTNSQGEVTTSIPVRLFNRWEVVMQNREIPEFVEPSFFERIKLRIKQCLSKFFIYKG